MQEQRDEQHPKIEDGIGRRGFLVAGVYGLLSVIAGSLGITSALYLLRGPKQKQGTTWADAGDLSALKSDLPTKVTFERTYTDGWRISNQKSSAWIVRNTDDTFIAFSPLCTHLGCAYQWQAKGGPSRHGAFVCPCHGSTFSKTGEVITGPANRPLDRYEIKRKGLQLWLGPISPTKKLDA